MDRAFHPRFPHPLPDAYTLDEIRAIRAFLDERGTFAFDPMPSGLFPASPPGPVSGYTGYANVWVRDTFYVAHAHHVAGDVAAAVRAAQALLRHFHGQRHRFLHILQHPADAADPMQRPHIRFDGLQMCDLDQRWPHAQNDALGYFLWLCCRLFAAGDLDLSAEDARTLALFPPYLAAIEYWHDHDSGHWEEARKVNASSIGVATAGLRQLERVLPQVLARLAGEGERLPSLIGELIARGEAALRQTLPRECIEPPSQHREVDAALLFLIYPMQCVSDTMADQILARVRQSLEGEIGIRRYLGDSFWCPDYREKLAAEERTTDWSERQDVRDALAVPGGEAQWCIFDPIVSTIYGKRFQHGRDPADLHRQVVHLNRSLRHLTPQFQCPELYCLEHGQWKPNDVTPLRWTQANLLVALATLEESLL